MLNTPISGGKTVVIGAGGTGGHMFPAAAFADEMRSRGWKVGLISDARGQRYAKDFPADWTETITASSPNLKRPWTLPKTVLQIGLGIARCKAILNAYGADFVIGFGGYPAFPVLAAARRKSIPLAIHEQNAVLGRVNRQFAQYARFIASGFSVLERLPPKAAPRQFVTGNPVRGPVRATRGAPYPALDETINILVTGGSQGTRLFGEIIPDAITQHVPTALKSRLHITHQVREAQIDDVKQTYSEAGVTATIQAFFSDMPARLQTAHIIIARSGAGTISEIAMIGRPSILIPLKIAMDNHQFFNAQSLENCGGAEIILEDDLTAKGLGALLEKWLSNPDLLPNMARKAAEAAHLGAETALADHVEATLDA